MLEKAIDKWNIDIEKSYFIGDSQRDIDAAKKCNIKGIKIVANEDLRNYCSEL